MACAEQTEKSSFEFIEDHKASIVLIITNVCLIAAIKDNGNVEETMLAEIITIQYIDADC